MTTQTQNGHGLVDLETGEQACPRCVNLKIDDLEALERENTRLVRLNARLENKLAEQDETRRRTHKDRKRILSLIDRWKEKTNHPRSKSSDDRFDVIVARLKDGYSFDEIELAIDGIAAFPYVVNSNRKAQGKPSQRHDRLGICLGSGEQLEKFANYGAQARRNGAG